MKDGVEYLLRFGNPTTVAGGEAAAPTAEQPDDTETAGSETGGRYLFVLARFNEALLAKPELQPLPEVPEDAAGKTDEPEADKSTAESDGKSGDESDEKSDEQQDEAAGDKPDDKPDDGEAADALAKADEEEAKAQAAIEERRRVERDNRLAQEAYDEKVKGAQKRVRELNNRFADWYYVVSDSEYAKIRLGRAEVIEAKPAEEASEAPADPPAP